MNKLPNISIILPTRNAATTIVHALDSIIKQNYPVKEIIVIDNKSKDNTLIVIKEWEKVSRRIVKIIENKTDRGVGGSYNVGVKNALSEYVVFMHSDSSLPSRNELSKLIDPFINDEKIIASYSSILMPKKNWDRYSFWMKCLFSRVVGKESPGLNCKFDCIKKRAFQNIGGFNGKNFAGKEMGAEDADLHQRLSKVGNVVLSKAKVIHLHYLGGSYTIKSYIKNRKVNARSYGRFMRIYPEALLKTKGLFIMKPLLAILPIIPGFFINSIFIFLIYSGINSKKMYLTKSTLTNPNILLLPLVDTFLIYYESYWMIQAFINKEDI